jgi:hypothetical protein
MLVEEPPEVPAADAKSSRQRLQVAAVKRSFGD